VRRLNFASVPSWGSVTQARWGPHAPERASLEHRNAAFRSIFKGKRALDLSRSVSRAHGSAVEPAARESVRDVLIRSA
jgi:hypothetical protein